MDAVHVGDAIPHVFSLEVRRQLGEREPTFFGDLRTEATVDLDDAPDRLGVAVAALCVLGDIPRAEERPAVIAGIDVLAFLL
jgi:hypothetical protein